MTRTSALLLVVLITGCASASRPPIDLEDRLARVEESRLRPVAAPQPAAASESPRPAPANVAANRSAVLVDQRDWHEALALSDMEDPPPVASPDAARQSSDLAAEREEKYLRRPPLRSFWDTVKRDIKNTPSDLWHDTKRVYANPVNLVILGAAYGGSLAIQETGPDSTVEHRFNRNNDFRAPDHIFNSQDVRDGLGALGNPGTHFALAGAWYLLGQQTMDDKTYEVGKTLFSALTINGLTVMVGQAASSDRAPNGEWGTFPSGHTSSSFVFASVMHEAYGPLVGVPLYGLASLVGIERLDDREHYLSDVVMGAVMGTVIGHSVASGRDPQFFGWQVLPYASPQNGSGVAFMKSFE